MGVLNETLAALFDGMEWPKRIERGVAEQLFSLALLREFSDDVPAGALVRVGALHFTAPASVAPVDGTEKVLLTLPFALDIERPIGPIGGGTVRTSSLDGQLRFGIAIKAEVEGDAGRQCGRAG